MPSGRPPARVVLLLHGQDVSGGPLQRQRHHTHSAAPSWSLSPPVASGCDSTVTLTRKWSCGVLLSQRSATKPPPPPPPPPPRSAPSEQCLQKELVVLRSSDSASRNQRLCGPSNTQHKTTRGLNGYYPPPICYPDWFISEQRML